jgi:hypothetical protein
MEGAGLMVMVVEVYSQTVEDARNDDGIRPAGCAAIPKPC